MIDEVDGHGGVLQPACLVPPSNWLGKVWLARFGSVFGTERGKLGGWMD
jgi:hypothetical protein